MNGRVTFSEHDNGSPAGFVGCCGMPALAHVKSGHPAMIAGHCGHSDALDEVIGAFALAYARQTEQDHAALRKAQRGRIQVVEGVV